MVRKDGKDGLISRDGKIIIPPQPTREMLFERMLNMNMAGSYERSCYITCTEDLKGLSKTTGEIVLPQIYSEIRFCRDLIVAAIKNTSNWNIKNSLFTSEGEPLLEGAFRNIRINEKDNTLTVETPEGIEHCVIEHTAS